MTEMNIRPATKPERMYSYSQSQQLSMQTGLIGDLRADMDTNGKGFFSSWYDFRKDLKTDEFKTELDEVVNALRFDEAYGGILKSRSDMLRYCSAHLDAEFDGNYCMEYGFRADTEKYAYIIRLNPQKGDYNLYCYCYVREWLDRNLAHAERGIRFINSSYKEQFRLPDGDTVRITDSEGKSIDRQCRYIDDYHLEVGNTLYHICEFAERMEEAGNSVIPLRSSLPDSCYGVLPSTGKLIIVVKGEKGYYETQIEVRKEDAAGIADEYNSKKNTSKAQSAAMLAGSMFGWGAPAADPQSYTVDGRLKSPKTKERGDER